MHEGARFINLHRGLATRAVGGVGAAAASFALCRNLKSTPPRCWGSGGNLARLSRKLAHASRRETRSLVRDRGSKSTGHHCVFSFSCLSVGFLTKNGRLWRSSGQISRTPRRRSLGTLSHLWMDYKFPVNCYYTKVIVKEKKNLTYRRRRRSAFSHKIKLFYATPVKAKWSSTSLQCEGRRFRILLESRRAWRTQ